jgi:hypothetical protein
LRIAALALDILFPVQLAALSQVSDFERGDIERGAAEVIDRDAAALRHRFSECRADRL